MAFFYVIDRTTGEFISANNFVPTNWASHVDPETGRPVEIKETNHELQPALTTPGPLGGHNWHPMSYSPTDWIGLYSSPRNNIYLLHRQ